MVEDIASQLAEGEARIFGMMIESHRVAGRQDLVKDRALTFGQSITDACIGWDDTVVALDRLAQGVAERRIALAE